ncbi:hypothetical protein F503_03206 [Ophiostoma piceae UAMH 11346]|uniref:Uncharacterized protein n=1 Tax=Ophiostoma piceae (strain UAMH 11346) TaxID=1262450 RepID=S3BZT3_OPHP1|nr:hypothetical protein F503_03206 [Ophiostoma piceae UAMH 11346]
MRINLHPGCTYASRTAATANLELVDQLSSFLTSSRRNTSSLSSYSHSSTSSHRGSVGGLSLSPVKRPLSPPCLYTLVLRLRSAGGVPRSSECTSEHAGTQGDAGGTGDVQAQAHLLARVQIVRATAAERGGLQHVAVGAVEEGLVELHRGIEALPVERRDLCAGSPKGHGVQVARRDARALGEHAHEVTRVVACNGGTVGGLGEVRGKTGLGHIDQMVVGPVCELAGRFEPRVVAGLDRLCIDADGGELGHDGRRRGGGRLLLLLVLFVGLELALLFGFVVARVARVRVVGRVAVLGLAGDVVLDHDDDLGAELGERDVLVGVVRGQRLGEQAVAQHLGHDLDDAQLAVRAAVVLERHDNGARVHCRGLVERRGGLLVNDLADGLADGAQRDVGHERVAVGHLWLLGIVVVVPGVDLDAARAGRQRHGIGVGGRVAEELVRLEVGVVARADKVLGQAKRAVGQRGRQNGMRLLQQTQQSGRVRVRVLVLVLVLDIVRAEQVLVDEERLERAAHGEVVLGYVSSTGAIAAAADRGLVNLVALVIVVLLVRPFGPFVLVVVVAEDRARRLRAAVCVAACRERPRRLGLRLEALDKGREPRTLALAALDIHKVQEAGGQADEGGEEEKGRADFAGRVDDGADNCRPKDAGALVGDGVERIEGGLGPGRDELAVERAAVAAEAAQDQPVDGSQRVHLPGLLQAADAPAAHKRQVARQAIQRNELKEREAGHDGVQRLEAEAARHIGPRERADDAGGRADDIDHAEGPDLHVQLRLGKQHGGGRRRGNGVGQQKPAGEEQHDVDEAAREADGAEERGPRVDEVREPRSGPAHDTTGLAGGGRGSGGQRRTGARPQPHSSGNGKQAPPGAHDKEHDAQRPDGVVHFVDDEDGDALDKEGGAVADADALGGDLGGERELERRLLLVRASRARRPGCVVVFWRSASREQGLGRVVAVKRVAVHGLALFVAQLDLARLVCVVVVVVIVVVVVTARRLVLAKEKQGMVPHEQGQKGVEQHKGGAKGGVGHDGKKGAEEKRVGGHDEIQHHGEAAGPGKPEQQLLAVVAVVGGAADAHDEQGLEEHADAEGVHGEAGGVDLDAEHRL